MKLKALLRALFFGTLRALLRSAGFAVEQVPCSNWQSSIYLLYRAAYWRKRPSTGLKQDDYFGFNIYSQAADLRAVFRNCYDEESTRILALLRASEIMDSFDYYDIGANYGTYSLPFSRMENTRAHVIVEANPFLVTALEKTFHATNATILSCAISTHEDSKVVFNVRPFASGSSSARTTTQDSAILSSLQLLVEPISYHRLFRSYATASSAVIKIDVEGFEATLVKDGFFEQLNTVYSKSVTLIELIPELLDASELSAFVNALKRYWCIPLSNITYRPKNQTHRADDSTRLCFDPSLRISDFYDIKYGKGIEWFSKEADFRYADILVFPTEALLNEALLHLQ